MGFRKRPRMSSGEARELKRIEFNPPPLPPVVATRTTRPVVEAFVDKEKLPEVQTLIQGKPKPKPHKKPKPVTFYIKNK